MPRNFLNYGLDIIGYIKYTLNMKRKKVKMGRPPIPAEEKRSIVVRTRMTGGEFCQLRKEAEKAGLSISSYLLKIWRENRG